VDASVRPATRDALADHLARYDRLVEVGVGNRPDVAAALAERASVSAVTATDVHDRPVPDGVRFVCDDVTTPDESVYRDADAIYALNFPPELHRPAWDLARRVDADFLFTTLGGDGPSIPTTPETLPGETLFHARRVPSR
jgi:uncharacterized UPF0146 family protein